jgi:hypothetical protein
LAAVGSLAVAAMMVGAKKKQSTKNSGGNSDGNGICNDLRYTAFFEQSIPVWNRLFYPTFIGIQYWKKMYSLGISIFYIGGGSGSAAAAAAAWPQRAARQRQQ